MAHYSAAAGNWFMDASAEVMKIFLRMCLKRASVFANSRPKLKRAIQVALNRFPLLKARLMYASSGLSVAATRRPSHSSTELIHLTPYAKLIHLRLKTAIEQSNTRKEFL
jgi:hypothetical protein